MVVVAFAIGIAGGAWARRSHAPRIDLTSVPGLSRHVQPAHPSIHDTVGSNPAASPSSEIPLIRREPSFERRLRDLLFAGRSLKDVGKFDKARLRRSLTAWTEADLRAAADYLGARSDVFIAIASEDTLPVVLQAWASKNGDASMTWASRRANLKERSALMAAVLGSMMTSDSEKAAHYLSKDRRRNSGIGEGGDFMPKFLGAWASEMPENAMRFLAENDSAPSQDEAVSRVIGAALESRAGKDVWAAITRLSAGATQSRLKRQFFRSCNDKEAVAWLVDEVRAGREPCPASEAAALRSLGSNELTALASTAPNQEWKEVLMQLALNKSGTDVASIEVRIAASESAMERDLLLDALADELTGAYKPAERRDRVGRIASPELRAQAIDQAIHQLCLSSDLDGATELLNLQDDDAMRDRSVMTLASARDEKDRTAAEAWLKQLPPSTERDWATLGIIASRAHTDARAAQNLLSLISGPEARRAAVMTLGAQWIQLSPANGRAWLGLQGLTPEQRADVEAAAQSHLAGAFKPDGGWTGKP